MLAQAIIAADETRLARRFLDEYAWGEDTGAARTADSLMRRLGAVPDRARVPLTRLLASPPRGFGELFPWDRRPVAGEVGNVGG